MGAPHMPAAPAPVPAPPPPQTLSSSALTGAAANQQNQATQRNGMGFDNTVLAGAAGLITPPTTKPALYGAGS